MVDIKLLLLLILIVMRLLLLDGKNYKMDILQWKYKILEIGKYIIKYQILYNLI